MKEIIGFIRMYYREVNKPILFFCILFTGILTWLNYHYKLEYRLVNRSSIPYAYFTGHLVIYFIAFIVPYLLLIWKRKEQFNMGTGFFICVLLAPAIFAIKVSMNTYSLLSDHPEWNVYWNNITYWPSRLVVMLFLISLCKVFFHRDKEFFGLQAKQFKWWPYWLMLLFMVPLLAAASTQPDFLSAYPKLSSVIPLPPGAAPSWIYKLFFELSYGSDFLSIELFFRGFLVIAFTRWVGKDAILPMACFYCTIHFGKPLGECISSFFGGMLLGIVSYHTRSIYGGLIVHLGIAWLMELGGYIGNSLK